MTPTAEFSHIVSVQPWPSEAIAIALTASDAECERLRKRFDLVEIKSLKAVGKIEKDGGDLVLDGELDADVVQTCVATLKPVPSRIKTSFRRRYRRNVDEGAISSREGNEILGDDEEDVDVLEGDHIDVGEVVAEEFYLALDPYPRAKDADFVLAEIQGVMGDDEAKAEQSPFAKLRRH